MGQTKKATIVNQVAGPMCIDIANTFYKQGYDTHLITGTLEPTYAELDDNVSVKLLTKYRRESGVKRIFTWTLFSVRALLVLLFSKKGERLLLVSNPPLAPFLGSILKTLRGQKYEVLIYDIYPDVLVNMGYIKGNSFINKLWSYYNRKSFKRAERVITLSKGMQQILGNYTDSTSITVIPCWVDSSTIKPIVPKAENPFAVKYEQVDKITVLYSGNMGAAHDVESIVLAANNLRDRKDTHFMLIGGGVKKPKIEQMIKEHDLANVTLLPFQDADVVPYSMSCGDIAIVTTEAESSSFMVPSKTYYYMSAGNYIVSISDNKSELSYIIEDIGIGKNIVHNETKSLAKVIEDAVEFTTAETKAQVSISASKYSPKLAEQFI